jgi:chromosome segregation protein
MGYIRKLEVKGFKSFGAKALTVNFEPGLTIITGPNGSGKSNVADAILFALGENSPRALRAAQGRLIGLIYDPKREGEEAYQEERLSGCRITIQLDNSDRKVPIDSDLLSITRELKKDGESVYYLNGKKSPKGVIADLLDVAGLSPSGLNIIPQNAATRVAELTPDEKRKMIEEVVGIAKFDEKKVEAQKQLSQADTKLSIEMARTGEMKSQLEKLEIQRNDLLRFYQLESQVNWVRAVQISRQINDLRNKVNLLKRTEEEARKKLDDVVKRKEEFENKIINVEVEKDRFILEIIHGGGPGPTALRDEREASKFKLDRLVEEIQAKEEDLKRLETETIPSLRVIISEKKKQITSAQSTVDYLLSTEEKLEVKRKEIAFKLDEVRSAEETLRITIERKKKQLAKIDEKLTELKSRLTMIDIDAGSVYANLSVEKKRLDELNVRVQSFSEMFGKLDMSSKQLLELHTKATQELKGIDNTLTGIEQRKSSISQIIEAATKVLEKVANEVALESAKRSVTQELSEERIGLSRLQTLCDEGGIRGYLGRVTQFIGYPKQYAKAVQAVLDNWLNAFVVEDTRSMAALIKAARNLNARSFAVIPLSEVENTSKVIVERSAGVIGPLSSILKSDKRYEGLLNFIAADNVLVESEAIGYLLASEGFRTVTPKGEVFELGARAFKFGYHDAVANILEGLEDIEDAGELESAVRALRGAIVKRKQQLSSLEGEDKSFSKDRIKKIASVAALKAEIESISRFAKRYRALFRSLSQDQLKQQLVVDKLSRKTSALKEKRDSIEKGILSLETTAKEIKSLELDRLLAEIEASRNDLTLQINEQSQRITEVHLSYTREKANLEQILVPSYEKIKQDFEVAESQYENDRVFIHNARKEVTELTRHVAELDSRLQKVLEASANSKPVIEEYENKIRRLREEKASLERSSANLEKDTYSIEQSIISSQEKLDQIMSSLRFWGYTDVLEVFEGSDQLLSQLEFEYEELAKGVNKIAEKEYAAIYDNYRNLSIRINELERERNSIVKFIESVEAEKKKVFITAFNTINLEFGKIFNRLTGGSATLELEKPDEIFSGGVFMMASFKGKSAWESASMSGGEKSVTAVSLILAIQKINPHPFYLFDEVDQNLDQLNSSSLASFLKERSREAQIIAITLKPDLVAASDVAYGVYSVGGVSKMVRSRLEVQIKSG